MISEVRSFMLEVGQLGRSQISALPQNLVLILLFPCNYRGTSPKTSHLGTNAYCQLCFTKFLLAQALVGVSLRISRVEFSTWHWERRPPLAGMRNREGVGVCAVERASYEASPFLKRRTLPPRVEDQQHSPSYPVTSPKAVRVT